MPATAAPTLDYTREEYLALDEAAPEGRRWEYDGTRVYLMAGATPEHNHLKDNVRSALHQRIGPRGCRSYTSDQRVHLPPRYVYPDVVAHCEDGRYTDESPPSLLNPELVVEVLSESTMDKDLTWKLHAYQDIASIQEVWFAWTEQVRVVQYARAGRGNERENGHAWTQRYFEDKGDVLRSEAFDLEIPIAELYELVL
ncbi:MAG: hypothetical protein BRD37_05875 [Bacteroidetes bacterium QH_8_67_23]|nr:MAG: hypothetical protein BRD37_05875 [Bacteroidetes bacterium QH_8_67_23]